jgi:hypothetical protein
MTPDAPDSFPIAFWLAPTSSQRRHLAAIIDWLGRELNAPSFEPHVTLYAGARNADDDVEKLLTEAAHEVGPIDLRVTAVRTSPKLFQALYLEFEPDSQSKRLYRLFQAGLRPSLQYVFKPHLSLLYKVLPATTRAALARRFDFVGQRITFEEIAAVRPGGGGNNWLDIQKWDVWLRKDLGSHDVTRLILRP